MRCHSIDHLVARVGHQQFIPPAHRLTGVGAAGQVHLADGLPGFIEPVQPRGAAVAALHAHEPVAPQPGSRLGKNMAGGLGSLGGECGAVEFTAKVAVAGIQRQHPVVPGEIDHTVVQRKAHR